MIIGIILAGGNSIRLGDNSIPKQFRLLNNKMVIDYSINAFSNVNDIHQVIVVVLKEWKKTISKKYPNLKIVQGGDTRRESSFLGLMACPQGTTKVLIHDAARIFVSEKIIIDCIKGLESSDAISTVIPSKDTLIQMENNLIKTIPDRKSIYKEQTPQAFNFDLIVQAHKKYKGYTTDDIRMVKELGVKCTTIPGDERNFKITTELDFLIAEYLLHNNY